MISLKRAIAVSIAIIIPRQIITVKTGKIWFKLAKKGSKLETAETIDELVETSASNRNGEVIKKIK